MMMRTINPTVEKTLKEWADVYQTPAFILSDPIQFPHRYQQKQDIEISGLLTAILSFGSRKMICRKCEELDQIMNHTPYQYLKSDSWRKDFPENKKESFYRTISFAQMHHYFSLLQETYNIFEDLESRLKAEKGNPMQRICRWMDVSEKSPQKKLNMFLRWMIRKDSPVDFGIWRNNT